MLRKRRDVTHGTCLLYRVDEPDAARPCVALCAEQVEHDILCQRKLDQASFPLLVFELAQQGRIVLLQA
uniref:Uncharacterized protein n=1 Tax=Paraburkholderia sprentiae WSM5005 TaxID=754502 RepID=A0A1I9YV05_9BURK